MQITCIMSFQFLWHQRSKLPHRDHFVRRPSSCFAFAGAKCIPQNTGVCFFILYLVLGKKDGLTGQFLRTNPHLQNTHCSAHRLALCSEQVAKKVPAMTEFQQTLEMIFYHFKKSPSKCDKIEAVQKLLDQPTVKYREVHQVCFIMLCIITEKMFI